MRLARCESVTVPYLNVLVLSFIAFKLVVMWEGGPYVRTATAGHAYGRLQPPTAPEAKEAQIQSFVQDRVQNNRMHAICEKRLLKLAEIAEHACRCRNSNIIEETELM